MVATAFLYEGLAAFSTLVLGLIALLQLRAFTKSEGRRTQPVVILHKGRGRDEVSGFGVFMTNEGVGTGYNVRVGLRIDGTEWPLGEDEGNRYTVRAGGREPRDENGLLTLGAPPWAYAKGPDHPSVDKRTIFYARYENAFGKVWETLNPNDPLALFEVQRARRPRRFHAWRQRRRRAKITRPEREAIVKDGSGRWSSLTRHFRTRESAKAVAEAQPPERSADDSAGERTDYRAPQ